MSEQAAAELAIPPVDTDGRELRLSTTTTDHVAVASHAVAIGGAVLHLEVLAASHRVRLVEPGVGAVTETVACDASSTASAELPADFVWSVGERTMAFTSEIAEGDALIAAAVNEINSLDPDLSIVARFPGHSMAYTAIDVLPAASDDAVAWRTWHLYPGPDAHVVFTSTVAARASVDLPAFRPSSVLQGVS